MEKLNSLENMKGLLRITIKRGINLAVRDVRTSDPYIIVCFGNQKVKTRVINNSLNPEWNEDLTLLVTDSKEPIKLTVYDYDILSLDDKMGDAEIDIKPLMEAVKMNVEGMVDETVITKVSPNRHNCIKEESNIVYKNGKFSQNIKLRLRNVDNGEIDLLLQWIDVPTTRCA